MGASGNRPKLLYFPLMPLDTPVPAANLKLAAQAVVANVLLRELIVAAITFWAYF